MTDRKKFQHVSSVLPPYTTKTGVQIGIAYQRPPQQLTRDGEIIQSILLGQRPVITMRNGMVWYATFLFSLFAVIGAVVSK